MTTTPARPRFITTPAGLACPAPSCNKTFTKQGWADRHWDTTHTGIGLPEPEQDDDEEFSPEVEAMHALVFGSSNDQDADEDERPDGCCGACPPIRGGGYDCTCSGNPRCGTTLGEALATAPATANDVQLLTPEQIHDATGWPCRIDPDAILALSDATTGLVDAITRLVAIGYARDEARAIVLALIDRLHDQPTPTAPAA